MDGTTVSHPTTTGPETYELNMKVTKPVFSNIVGGVTYKNHGELRQRCGWRRGCRSLLHRDADHERQVIASNLLRMNGDGE